MWQSQLQFLTSRKVHVKLGFVRLNAVYRLCNELYGTVKKCQSYECNNYWSAIIIYDLKGIFLVVTFMEKSTFSK